MSEALNLDNKEAEVKTSALKKQLDLRTYYFFNPDTIADEPIIKELLLSSSAHISEFHFSDLDRAINMSHFYFTMIKKERLNHLDECYQASFRSRFYNFFFRKEDISSIFKEAKSKISKLQKDSALALLEYKTDFVSIEKIPEKIIVKSPVIPVGKNIILVDFSGIASNDGIYIQDYEISHFDIIELQRSEDKIEIDIEYHSFEDKTFESLREIHNGEYSNSNRSYRLFNSFKSAEESIKNLFIKLPIIHSDKNGVVKTSEILNNTANFEEFKNLNKPSLSNLSSLSPPEYLSDD